VASWVTGFGGLAGFELSVGFGVCVAAVFVV